MTLAPLSITVRRDLAALEEITRLLDGFFGGQALNGSARYAVELAVEEIFTNMVRHNSAGTSDIRIDVASADGEVIVKLTDFDAPRFDPLTDAPPAGIERQLEQRMPGGLGIHLVRQMIDHIEYSHDDRTATVTLRKRAS